MKSAPESATGMGKRPEKWRGRIVEEKFRLIPSKGRAKLIHKVCEVNPMVCP
jgi:hypothetical protein